MYPNSLIKELVESVSWISLLKRIPDSDEGNFVNNLVFFCPHPATVIIKTKKEMGTIKEFEYICCCVLKV